mmetsp:Transcript_28313/g.39368  ORF Transcript_28313/g.39368 Transcript_28313/m.39368 type:complete len:99 (-) Transcript_28313:839-1135(-)
MSKLSRLAITFGSIQSFDLVHWGGFGNICSIVPSECRDQPRIDGTKSIPKIIQVSFVELNVSHLETALNMLVLAIFLLPILDGGHRIGTHVEMEGKEE